MDVEETRSKEIEWSRQVAFVHTPSTKIKMSTRLEVSYHLH